MKINVEQFEKFVEVKLDGRLDTNTSPDLEKSLTEILNGGTVNVLINFKNLTYISSSGLRVFLVAAKLLDEEGSKLNFCGMKDYIKEVFDIAGFSVLFNFFDSREQFTD